MMLKKALFTAIVFMLIFLSIPSVCYANAAAPPTLLIIVPNAPSDLEISIEPQMIKSSRTDTLVESYFAFYALDLRSGEYTAKVDTGSHSFEVTLNLDIRSQSVYTNVFMLDLASHTLIPNKPSVLRSVSLLSFQILLKILIESIVFFLFGFRKKRSWFIFLIMNLITQGVLYAWLTKFHAFPPNGNYIIFFLIFGEIIVFTVEMVGLLMLLKERPRILTAGYVIAANLLSLIAGGFIITALPVYF